jgi:hypothetical protein
MNKEEIDYYFQKKKELREKELNEWLKGVLFGLIIVLIFSLVAC